LQCCSRRRLHSLIGTCIFRGFHTTHGIAALTMPSGIGQMIFAVTGSIAVGATAWTRMAMLTPAPSERGNAGRQVQP